MITVITDSKPIIVDCRYNSMIGDVTKRELFDRHGKRVPKDLRIRGDVTLFSKRTLCTHLDQVSQSTDSKGNKTL